MENLKLHDQAINRNPSSERIYSLDVSKTKRKEPPSQKKRRTFKKIKRRLIATRRMAKSHFRRGMPKLKFPKPSLPASGSLFLLALFVFSFMCYLLGVDPSLIPFTLVFTIVISMILLEEKQRDMVIEKVFPQTAVNFFRWIWACISCPKKKNEEDSYSKIEISNEDEGPYQNIQMQHQIINDELEHPLLCI